MTYEKDWVDKAAWWMMWGGWFIYMLWALAKMFGLINTPVWILAIPYVVGGIAIAGFFVGMGKYLQRFENLEKDVKILKKDVSANKIDIAKIKTVLS